MNRLLLFCCCVMLFTACKKVSDPAVINSKQKEIDDDIIAQYIRENNLTVVNAGDTTGVRAIIVKQVPGNTLYSVSSSVTVGYTGKQLTSGKIFAQTDSIHPSFKLGEALSGWKIGILKGQVNKGGIIRLIIPSRHGYGPYAQPGLGLPANAILDFTIEIFDVTN